MSEEEEIEKIFAQQERTTRSHRTKSDKWPNWMPTDNQRAITCFSKKVLKTPDWERVIENCIRNGVKPVKKAFEGQGIIYTLAREDEQSRDAIGQLAKRANLHNCWDIAFPSDELKHLIEAVLGDIKRNTLFGTLIGLTPEDHPEPGIYVVFNHEDPFSKMAIPLYVGQTINFLEQRFHGHRQSQKKPKDKAGFIDYARYCERTNQRAAYWCICFFPLERCREIAIQGQLIPAIELDLQQAKNCIAEKCKNKKFALDKAEHALIANYHPHFNQLSNVIRRKLLRTDYCQQHCRLCNPYHKERDVQFF